MDTGKMIKDLLWHVVFLDQPGKWALSSKKDERWMTNGFVSSLKNELIAVVTAEITRLHQLYGEPPEDLECIVDYE